MNYMASEKKYKSNGTFKINIEKKDRPVKKSRCIGVKTIPYSHNVYKKRKFKHTKFKKDVIKSKLDQKYITFHNEISAYTSIFYLPGESLYVFGDLNFSKRQNPKKFRRKIFGHKFQNPDKESKLTTLEDYIGWKSRDKHINKDSNSRQQKLNHSFKNNEVNSELLHLNKLNIEKRNTIVSSKNVNNKIYTSDLKTGENNESVFVDLILKQRKIKAFAQLCSKHLPAFGPFLWKCHEQLYHILKANLIQFGLKGVSTFEQWWNVNVKEWIMKVKKLENETLALNDGNMTNLNVSQEFYNLMLVALAELKEKGLISPKQKEYCTQMYDAEFETKTCELLQTLYNYYQRKVLESPDPNKFLLAKDKRRLVYGFKDCCKWMELGKLCCLIIAPDLEFSLLRKDSLCELILSTIYTALQYQIPYLFSVSRKKLPKYLYKISNDLAFQKTIKPSEIDKNGNDTANLSQGIKNLSLLQCKTSTQADRIQLGPNKGKRINNRVISVSAIGIVNISGAEKMYQDLMKMATAKEDAYLTLFTSIFMEKYMETQNYV